MLLLINPNGILNIFIAVIIGITVYFVILFILKGLNKDEFKFIRELLM
jgi:capsular polysaccharide biosynthesis protein